MLPSFPTACRLFVVALALSLSLAPGAAAQPTSDFYSQTLLGDLLDRQAEGSGAVVAPDEVPYARYVLDHPSGNSVIARHVLYREVGGGDTRRGRDRMALSALLNGRVLTATPLGDSLVLPARPEDFDLNPLSFAPFPSEYPGAADYDRLVVIHKDAQAWAAYEEGRLVRWGPASTGALDTPTPTGRFTFNWRQEERVSSESPPGEEWRMRWVLNFHYLRGIHIHQYAVPTGAPEGHGCVRIVEADARWLYDWAEPWTTTAGRGALGGREVAPGSTVLVLGEEPDGEPVRFVDGPDGPRRLVVELPEDPASVPRGDR